MINFNDIESEKKLKVKQVIRCRILMFLCKLFQLSMFINITIRKNFTFLFLSTDPCQNHVLQLVNTCHSGVGSS